MNFLAIKSSFSLPIGWLLKIFLLQQLKQTIKTNKSSEKYNLNDEKVLDDELFGLYVINLIDKIGQS